MYIVILQYKYQPITQAHTRAEGVCRAAAPPLQTPENRNYKNRDCVDGVKLGYNVTKGTEYFILLRTSVVITEENNAVVNSEESIGTTEYLTL
jgi:hypothetical protein